MGDAILVGAYVVILAGLRYPTPYLPVLMYLVGLTAGQYENLQSWALIGFGAGLVAGWLVKVIKMSEVTL